MPETFKKFSLRYLVEHLTKISNLHVHGQYAEIVPPPLVISISYLFLEKYMINRKRGKRPRDSKHFWWIFLDHPSRRNTLLHHRPESSKPLEIKRGVDKGKNGQKVITKSNTMPGKFEPILFSFSSCRICK